MRLLITGCGHSGTHWVRDILRSAGYEVGHEHACDYGGWKWEKASEIEVSWCAGAYLDQVGDMEVWQLVRHPLRVAATFRRKEFFSEGGDHRHFVNRVLPDLDHGFPELDYWLRWNEIVETRASRRWRVEEIGSEFFECVRVVLGGGIPRFIDHPIQNGGDPIDWAQYARAGDLQNMARRYGYELEG